ncbi:WG repeat-containing protein [Leptospira noguchii]|uniref:WG repeat-containing protein n=1 Tax=Leptospira noguchii TaxID=28182 RepID=UPI0007739D06
MKDQILFPVRSWSNDKKNSKLGYINTLGQWTIEPEYENAEEFHEGFAQVKKDGKNFIINERNETIFEIQTGTDLGQFHEGLAIAYIEEKRGRYKCGYMNLKGEVVIPFQYERAENFKNGLGSVQSSENQKWGAVDKSGQLIIPFKFLASLYFEDQAVAIANEDYDLYGVIDLSGRYMIQPKFESIGRFSEGLANVRDKKTRKHGFIDLTGNYKIDPIFEYSNGFSGGFAAIHDDKSKWGHIDTSGKIAVPTKFRSTGDFSEGFADALTNKWGYIDPTGTWAIQPTFTRTSRFSNGVAVVEIKNKYGLINTSGEYILPPIYNHIDNSLPGLIKASFSPSPKTSSYNQFFTRDGKLVWTEFEPTQTSNLQIVSSPKKNDIVVPENLIADLKTSTEQIISELGQKNEAALNTLTNISWEEVFTEVVRQLDAHWQDLTTQIEEELSGVLFFWDDDVGLSFCFATGNNDPEDILNEFDGGEPAVDFDFVFSKLSLRYEEIHSRLRNDLLDVVFEKALALTLSRSEFLKIKKTNPLYIYRSYSHDDYPPELLFKVGKDKPKILKEEKFISQRVLKEHLYFSQIFGQNKWLEIYEDEFNEVSQDDLSETLNLFLFTYLKESSKPEYIKAIADRLPRSPETVHSNRLALTLAGYFCLIQEPQLALQHLHLLKKTEHLKTHFLWAREHFSLLEENPEFQKIVQWVNS